MSNENSLDPSHDPRVRTRAHLAMSHVYSELKNIMARHYDANGKYIEPPGVEDGGDNTGMMYAANNEVLRRLDEEVQNARASLLVLFAEIDDYKRDTIGPGYNPAPRKL